MNSIVLFFVTIFSTVASQICWKVSSMQVLKVFDSRSLLIKQSTNIWFIVGWILYLFATFLWVYLLSKYEYSKIYPIFVGACIVLSLIIGFVFFKENTGMLYKTIGAALIICGITIITRS